jgi:flagellar biosynthesis GTPase FlhF
MEVIYYEGSSLMRTLCIMRRRLPQGGSLKPKMFIGSSVEGLSVAYAIQQNLDYEVESTVWTQGVFRLSRSAAEALIQQLDNMDFGVFVLTPDDIVNLRGEANRAVRDNVIFELGLFIGRLGRERSFIVKPQQQEGFHLPTDLVGMTAATYNSDRSDRNIQAATGPACHQIREVVTSFTPHTTTSRSEDEQQLEQLSTKLHEVEQERERLEKELEEVQSSRAESARQIETLEGENERLKAEAEQLKAERDGQLRVRCLQVSEELEQFVQERERKDPHNNALLADATDAELNEHSQALASYDQETMRLYNEQFRGKVDVLRVDLDRVGWWSPKKDPKRIENPVHIQDVNALSNYLRGVAHRFW